MSATACQQALDAVFRADPTVQAALGNPVRLVEAPVKLTAYPFAIWRRWETKPIDSSLVQSDEHIATLEVVCRQNGAEVAREAVAALASCAAAARPNAIGARIVLILPLFCDVLRSADGRSWLGLVRLKIIADRN
ncbi:DUF3168 domain-containing protein [Aquidulcibacter sp.]|uniref:tail completion protein gp17 n=1 Tax=Aquidulcibacter sp. TaxID=2052990 RepID=UPI0025C71E45|nr:DUF3168 domain-containing protein [Aquidulcibacter sp.]MCA3692685.1 DUF3168 domain-containing protein [Aquidulcibacter sp.]